MTQLFRIGPHKTGSTFIQRVFLTIIENAQFDSGVTYPNIGFKGEYGQHEAVEKIRALRQEQLDEYMRPYLHGAKNVVSSENFDRLNLQDLRKIKMPYPLSM